MSPRDRIQSSYDCELEQILEMTSTDFKYLVPEKAQPSGCCTCRRWTIVLGVVASCMFGAIIVTLAIMNLEYFQSDLERVAELRDELVSVEESREVLNDPDCEKSQLPVLYDVDFKPTGLVEYDGKCRQTRIKLEVIPCGDGENLLAVHNVNIDNDFEYYLVNDGGIFKESVQEKHNEEQESSPEETYGIPY